MADLGPTNIFGDIEVDASSGSIGGAFRIAFCNGAAPAAVEIPAWLDIDNSGEAVVVQCNVIGGGDLSDSAPLLIDGQKMPVVRVNDTWYSLTLFHATGILSSSSSSSSSSSGGVVLWRCYQWEGDGPPVPDNNADGHCYLEDAVPVDWVLVPPGTGHSTSEDCCADGCDYCGKKWYCYEPEEGPGEQGCYLEGTQPDGYISAHGPYDDEEACCEPCDCPISSSSYGASGAAIPWLREVEGLTLEERVNNFYNNHPDIFKNKSNEEKENIILEFVTTGELTADVAIEIALKEGLDIE